MKAFALIVFAFMASILPIIAQSPGDGPACGQTCIASIPGISSSCATDDLPCRCVDQDVTFAVADCITDGCSENDKLDAESAFVQYCVDIAIPRPPSATELLPSWSSQLASVSRLTATASRIYAGDDPITSTSSSARPMATANDDPEGTTAGPSQENTGNSAVGIPYTDNILKAAVIATVLTAIAVMSGGFLGLSH